VLDVDEIQANEILNLQLRRLAALERQRSIDELAEIEAEIPIFEAILASDARQREIVDTELAEIVEKYGDERRSRFVAYDGDMSAEDFITEEPVVVTITRAPATRSGPRSTSTARRSAAARASRGRSSSRTTSSTTSS
jgi:DNA gyrase subunit A